MDVHLPNGIQNDMKGTDPSSDHWLLGLLDTMQGQCEQNLVNHHKKSEFLWLAIIIRSSPVMVGL